MLLQYYDNHIFTGVYYYSIGEHKNYEQVIFDVASYARQMGIPYKYVQYDAWWYYTSTRNNSIATTKWEGMPTVFPDGMA